MAFAFQIRHESNGIFKTNIAIFQVRAFVHTHTSKFRYKTFLVFKVPLDLNIASDQHGHPPEFCTMSIAYTHSTYNYFSGIF